MTLDVAIGKVTRHEEPRDEELGVGIKQFFDVEECPDADFDVCNPENTIYPRESYRSGSSGFWKFWTDNPKLNEIYTRMREDKSDIDISYLKLVLKDIQKLKPEDATGEGDHDRLKWLQYWSKKAVELYGSDAGIKFS